MRPSRCGCSIRRRKNLVGDLLHESGLIALRALLCEQLIELLAKSLFAAPTERDLFAERQLAHLFKHWRKKHVAHHRLGGLVGLLGVMGIDPAAEGAKREKLSLA